MPAAQSRTGLRQGESKPQFRVPIDASSSPTAARKAPEDIITAAQKAHDDLWTALRTMWAVLRDIDLEIDEEIHGRIHNHPSGHTKCDQPVAGFRHIVVEEDIPPVFQRHHTRAETLQWRREDKSIKWLKAKIYSEKVPVYVDKAAIHLKEVETLREALKEIVESKANKMELEVEERAKKVLKALDDDVISAYFDVNIHRENTREFGYMNGTLERRTH
ncbi:hypothetical protein EJ04DRAFT_568263 [Polyplosphaeria fusca]|uniref:Uncharacterized protein n=1 Tax=Polyplosphaeria fusca TaxID=682080 RepID=A0A9P4UYA2_9PLEO|nr:hypothetical protein EJ04DRAFT_568263 [Polyplosphaeria fusca]